MTDATLIAADASSNSLVNNDPQEAKKEAEAQRQDHGMIGPSQQRRVTNQTHSSRTDPDATLAQKKGTPRQLKYKVHKSIDADSRVILDTEVTTGARHDNQPYLAQLERLAQKYNINITEAIADRGYGSAAIIRALQENGMTTYVPLWSGKVGNSKHMQGGFGRTTKGHGQTIHPKKRRSGSLRRGASSNARSNIQAKDVGADVEDRRTVRRSEKQSRAGTSQVSKPIKSPNSSPSKRDGSKPKAPRLFVFTHTTWSAESNSKSQRSETIQLLHFNLFQHARTFLVRSLSLAGR